MRYLRSVTVYLVAGLRGVDVEKGHQVLLCVPECMEHILHGCGWLVVLILGLLLEAAGVRMAVRRLVWSCHGGQVRSMAL